jgi:hypothetical protein
MNPVALYDTLNLASTSVLLAEAGDAKGAETMLLEASLSAMDAFPAGTHEAHALGVILAAAGRVQEMTA